ncbi:cofactor-independent phosphoglycerate mutase [Methanobrevibacter millerae]|uniref:phosphoglycerate mutase (2,3-diphosphoglycerate-independent) n=1 Tax=Methanobrevibacter millerae TaxID=230361 RepID=A0A1G5V486_9EURY|nr:cofactor-independent phosphoglycerate mutase [Methanobrevibacter millerae]SDA40097.1 2,3-bisphosphoglycerate-independent phosphoglycerate mutase [Methanobrevibacter millerae]
MKYVIFIPDGASDLPIDELDGKTPLQVAKTPNIDKLAENGFGGFTNNVPDGYTPGSDVANMSIFGYNPAEYYTGRGPLEAGSVGIKTTPRDVIFRCNTITEKDDMMDDFNAGHITSEEAAVLMDALNEYFNEKYDDFRGKFYAGISYRHLFVYSCESDEDAELLANLDTVPPHDISGKSLTEYTSWSEDLEIKMRDIMYEAQEVLKDHEVNLKRIDEGKAPANMVWFWGQGLTPKLSDFKETYGLSAAVITGVDLLKGIGIFANMDIIDVPGATGFFDTDYKAKGEYGIEALKTHDVLFIHIEAPDEAGHAQLIDEKVKAIERIDEFIVGPVMESLEGQDFKAAILPDHPTPISIGTHTRDDIPLVVYASGRTGDGCTSFDEEGVKTGSIEKQEGYKLMSRLINEF